MAGRLIDSIEHVVSIVENGDRTKQATSVACVNAGKDKDEALWFSCKRKNVLALVAVALRKII